MSHHPSVVEPGDGDGTRIPTGIGKATTEPLGSMFPELIEELVALVAGTWWTVQGEELAEVLRRSTVTAWCDCDDPGCASFVIRTGQADRRLDAGRPVAFSAWPGRLGLTPYGDGLLHVTVHSRPDLVLGLLRDLSMRQLASRSGSRDVGSRAAGRTTTHSPRATAG